ncbi:MULTISPECIES: DUF485 domain-containing protein [unclassified Frankia]|uniref:DUF485 domain-containing protein n=2 Tax=Frankia TaxID=1854 RepID=UPI001EF4FBEC|nr:MULTISPECIES: DUF485 domain-containing protein [unclassified Frankia]
MIDVVHGGEGKSHSGSGSVPSYRSIQDSPEFIEHRRRFQRFVFPVTALFLTWYFLYVCLAAFARGFMATKVIGNINIGLLFGFGQFVSTFTITMIYIRWADRRFDPTAERLRAHFEGGGS